MDVINDVLDISKAEANKLKLQAQRFDLDNLIRTTLKGLSVLAVEKDLSLNWEKTDDVPRYVKGDPQRLRQILVNLVGNAIKYSDQGQVDIAVERVLPSQEDLVQLRFNVKDTGIGIPEGQLAKIFDDYTQAGKTTNSEGSGLGLSICRELVKLMGGEIHVTSELPKGSVFSFSVSLEPGSGENPYQNEQPVPTLHGFAGIKVLIADDNLINVKVAVAHLSRLGYATAAVGNGQEVLEALAAADFDVVLMDLEMPKLNGVEAIRRIRSGQDNVRNPEIPIIVLTAYSLTDAQEQCEGIDVNDFMLKPVSFHELAARINQLRFPPETTPDALAALDAANTKKMKYPVLDSRTARLRLELDETSYQTIFALSLTELSQLQNQLRLRKSTDALSDSATIVHTIKSTAATIGALALQHAAIDLEQTLRHRDQTESPPAYQRLDDALNDLFEQDPHTS